MASAKGESSLSPKKSVKRRTSGVSKGNSGTVAYDDLKRRIVMLDLQPGADLDEAALGLELGISRTPLREALVRLASEGLVTVLPNRGARVASLELTHLQAHLEAFALAQRAVTRLAALRRSEADLQSIALHMVAFEEASAVSDVERMVETNFDFHFAISKAARNPILERFYVSQLTESLRVARLAMAYEWYGTTDARNHHVGEILREHRELLDALRRRDADMAEKLAGSHSDLARKRVSEYLSLKQAEEISVVL